MTSFQETSASMPWGIVKQFANHRDVLQLDGTWINETARDSKPRMFGTQRAAERYVTRAVADTNCVYVSRLRVPS